MEFDLPVVRVTSAAAIRPKRAVGMIGAAEADVKIISLENHPSGEKKSARLIFHTRTHSQKHFAQVSNCFSAADARTQAGSVTETPQHSKIPPSGRCGCDAA